MTSNNISLKYIRINNSISRIISISEKNIYVYVYNNVN